MRLYKGEVVHQETKFNEQLVLRMLASRDPYRFGQQADVLQSEVLREASTEQLHKAMALIATESTQSADGRLSLAEVCGRLTTQLDEIVDDEKAVERDRGDAEWKATFGWLRAELGMPPDDGPGGGEGDDPPPNDPQPPAQEREQCELPPAEASPAKWQATDPEPVERPPTERPGPRIRSF